MKQEATDKRFRFIPFRKHDIVEMCLQEGCLKGQEEDFRMLYRMIDNTFHFEFHRIIEYCQEHIVEGAVFKSFDTICRQVSNRVPNLKKFAERFDMILFVAGRKSSNGQYLYTICKEVNDDSYFITRIDEIKKEWFEGVKSVGICGATSTPNWLMEDVEKWIHSNFD